MTMDGRYYVEGHAVFKAPLGRKREGGSTVTLGFRVCDVPEWLKPEDVANVLNAGEFLVPELLAALREIDKSIDSLCGLISKAQYNADELQHGIAAWEPVADVMHDGTMAMIREEIRDAIAKAEAGNG